MPTSEVVETAGISWVKTSTHRMSVCSLTPFAAIWLCISSVGGSFFFCFADMGSAATAQRHGTSTPITRAPKEEQRLLALGSVLLLRQKTKQ